jgi:hypothetical protein
VAVFLSITNPALEDFEATALSRASSAGATILNVLSGLGFRANQILLFGRYDEENAEIVRTHAATAPTSSQITLAAGALFPHSTNTPIRLMPYDRFRIYQSNDGGLTFFLADTIDIRPDKNITTYISPATAAARFRIASFNTLTGKEGTLSDVIVGTGLDFGAVGAILDRVYDLYNDPTQKFIKSDDIILNYLNEGIQDMWTRMTGLGQGYGVKRTGTTSDPDISLVSGQTLYSFLSDMVRPMKIALDYSGSGRFVAAKPYDPLFKDEDNQFSETEPGYHLLHDQIEIDPTPRSATGRMRLWYAAMPAPIFSITDRPKLPAVHLTTKTLVDFCVARIYEKAFKSERASYFLQAYENGVTAWLSAIAKRRGDFPSKVGSFADGLRDEQVIY